MKAWRVVRSARPTEALELLEVDRPEPGPGQVRAQVDATACNFNEVDGCYGRYKTVDPPLPYTLGMEAVGVVDAVGEGAEAWLGRRVMLTGVGATGAHADDGALLGLLLGGAGNIQPGLGFFVGLVTFDEDPVH